ncbi:imidazole glycerol phosphate synthase subunit HisH [Ilyobacter polytropus]|uniref:Imidazole glycerol phosphate synthase subunit HisH n=1 Tax=Ilyobacter polytropus (strain ATCC 51220 / DSM 2926 / LMG 16218 / CuHBu1) TaxID=572544 RepID=E3HCR4_ILYPC|nr:imidazole glycerol phosphate synthase subunit HisH [Ilyobacter polytropus]ADO84459.1 imidazole glycerol phosphate synthase subunit hisH [Ilyobacter polytropus DSM 2926]
MIAIIDYGVGNIHSVMSALNKLNIENILTADPEIIKKADGILLPGVGAFRDAIKSLEDTGLVPLIKDCVAEGKPLLGICLGMQLLYEKSFEDGEYEGLGLLKGEVISFKSRISEDLKIPHMGWNRLNVKKDSQLFKYLGEDEFVYYVHSYYASGKSEDLLASSEYGIEVPGVVGHGNIMGMQFHPEKSSSTGLKLLKAFGEMVK